MRKLSIINKHVKVYSGRCWRIHYIQHNSAMKKIWFLIFDILANPPNLSTIPCTLENIKLTSRCTELWTNLEGWPEYQISNFLAWTQHNVILVLRCHRPHTNPWHEQVDLKRMPVQGLIQKIRAGGGIEIRGQFSCAQNIALWLSSQYVSLKTYMIRIHTAFNELTHD